MKELIVVGILALLVFGFAYYQSYRDKWRWKRISSGMSLFGDRKDIPPLVVDGVSFESNDRQVQVIWSDMKRTGFDTVFDARKRIERDIQSGRDSAKTARIFAWDGEGWKQRR